MKYLGHFKEDFCRDTGKFLYVEVNSDIRDAVKEGAHTGKDGEKEEEKKAVREGRKQVLNSFPDLNDALIKKILSSNATEDGWNFDAISRLKNSVKKSIFDVIQDTSDTPPITAERGISSRDIYTDFVNSVYFKTENTEHTIGDVDFALSALTYTETAFANRVEIEKKKEHSYRSLLHWLTGKETSKNIFNTRSREVLKVFTEIKGELGERKKNIEKKLADHSSRVTQEVQAMSPDERGVFLKQVQQEIDSKIPTNHLNRNHREGIMENLNVAQRVEVYKLANLDQNVTNLNLESISKGDEHVKTGFRASRDALNQYVGDLELNKIRSNLGLNSDNIEPKNLLGDTNFLQEFKNNLDLNGSINRNPQFFQNYSNNFDLGNHENFIAYCRILQDNSDYICDVIPASFKKKILACLKWIEEEEQVNQEDIEGISKEFKEVDKNLTDSFDEFQTLVLDLNKVNNLGGVKSTGHLDAINKLTATCIGQVALFEDLKGKNKFSTEELAFLETKYEKLEQLGENVLPRLRKKYDESLHDYKQKEKEYNKFKIVSETLVISRNKISQKKPKELLGKKKRVTNQSTLDEWSQYNADINKVQQKLAEIRTDMGATDKKNDPELGNFAFSFGDQDLRNMMSQIDSDISLIKKDKKDRGRVKKKDINQPNQLFQNYLMREASKDQNKIIDNKLELNREKSLGYLKQKQVGSLINIKCLPYRHGNPPTSDDILNNKDPEELRECIVLSNKEGKSGTVLYDKITKKIIVVQKGTESGRIEVLVLPRPEGVDVATEGLTEGFDLGITQEYVATPICITIS